jgi:hypothetical protein
MLLSYSGNQLLAYELGRNNISVSLTCFVSIPSTEYVIVPPGVLNTVLCEVFLLPHRPKIVRLDAPCRFHCLKLLRVVEYWRLPGLRQSYVGSCQHFYR